MNEWSKTHKETETQTQEEKQAEEAREKGQVEEKPEGMPEVLFHEADLPLLCFGQRKPHPVTTALLTEIAVPRTFPSLLGFEKSF